MQQPKNRHIQNYVVIPALFLMCSCGASENAPAPGENDSLITATEEQAAVEVLSLDTTLFELPLTITNDNIDVYYNEEIDVPLTTDQVDDLGLLSLRPGEGTELFVLGEIDLSEKFKTRLVFENNGWNEWTMWLVSYDANDRKVGDVEILYGDNVEGLSETYTSIEGDQISVTKLTYGFDDDSRSGIVETYWPNDHGVFLKMTESDLPENFF